jgi:hypothetical protein
MRGKGKEKELEKIILPCLHAFNLTNMSFLGDRQEEAKMFQN